MLVAGGNVIVKCVVKDEVLWMIHEQAFCRLFTVAYHHVCLSVLVLYACNVPAVHIIPRHWASCGCDIREPHIV